MAEPESPTVGSSTTAGHAPPFIAPTQGDGIDVNVPGSPSSPSSPSRRRANRSAEPLRIPPALQVVTPDMVKMSRTVAGVGSFARVVHATLHKPNEDPKPVAVKVINRYHAMQQTTVDLQAELDICSTLHHPCIINVHGAFEDAESVYIVMDLAEKGELCQYIRDVGCEDMPIVAPNFLAEVVLGLEYMCSQGVVHRDIKPENLLLTSGFHVKIADFGTVCRVDGPQSFTGTPAYVSPEMLATSKASRTSDVWALGCVLYQLFVGRSPFQADDRTEYQTIEAVKKRDLSYPVYFPATVRDLVDKMLEMDPEKRIGATGFDEIKRHPFFEKVKWDGLLSKNNETFLNADFTAMYEKHLLPTERVVFSGLVTKERYKGLSVKERILVLTDYPQLFYLDPRDKNRKIGHVPWDKDLCAQADSPTVFHCHTSGTRVYHFQQANGLAALWASKINHLVRTKRS